MLLNMTMLAQCLDGLTAAGNIRSDPAQAVLTHPELYEPGMGLMENAVYLLDSRAVSSEERGTLSFPLDGSVDVIASEAGDRPLAESKTGESEPAVHSRMATDAASAMRTCVAIEAPDIDRCHFICIGEVPAFIASREKAEYLLVKGVTLPRLLGVVQAIFQRYDVWDRTLKEIMMRRGLVADMLDASMAVFRSNILVHDRNMKTIAFRTHDRASAPSPLEDLTIDRTMSDDTLDTFNSTVAANSPDIDPFSIVGPHFWTSANGPQCLNMNIFNKGTFIARVVLTTQNADEEPTPKDLVPFITLCSYIQTTLDICYSNLMGSSEDALASLLRRIIEGETVDESRLQTAAADKGWDCLSDHFQLFAIEMDAAANKNINATYPLISLFNRIAETIPNAHNLIVDSRGITVMDLSRCTMSCETLYAMLDHVAKDNGCRFFTARESTGAHNLKRRYEEALLALDAARGTIAPPDANRIITLEDMALRIVDRSVTKTVSPISLCPQGLLDVISFDNKHHSELYRTLRTYMETNCSPSKSARALYVQRSTFLYRLNKALCILSMDLDDPEDQLRLRLAFRLLDTLPSREFHRL